MSGYGEVLFKQVGIVMSGSDSECCCVGRMGARESESESERGGGGEGEREGIGRGRMRVVGRCPPNWLSIFGGQLSRNGSRVAFAEYGQLGRRFGSNLDRVQIGGPSRTPKSPKMVWTPRSLVQATPHQTIDARGASREVMKVILVAQADSPSARG